MDTDLRNLERDARSGKISFQEFQVARDRLGLTYDDAEYLREYLTICENLSSHLIDSQEITDLLRNLNDEYKYRVHSRTLRSDTGRMVEDLKTANESWSSSDCWPVVEEEDSWQGSGAGC